MPMSFKINTTFYLLDIHVFEKIQYGPDIREVKFTISWWYGILYLLISAQVSFRPIRCLMDMLSNKYDYLDNWLCLDTSKSSSWLNKESRFWVHTDCDTFKKKTWNNRLIKPLKMLNARYQSNSERIRCRFNYIHFYSHIVLIYHINV